MNVYIVQKNGYNSLSSHNEFGENTGHMKMQTEYILVVNADLRDVYFHEVYRQLQKWICRLAKRTNVLDIMVEIRDCEKSNIIRNEQLDKSYNTKYGQMFEQPSWGYRHDIRPAWYEYLMWDRDTNSCFPKKLLEKYFV